MSDHKEEIEAFVVDKFSFIQKKFGLQKPTIKRDVWFTVTSYLNKNFAIEVELDWRDIVVSVLITRLDNGELPDGYYTAKGKVCRIHLENVLQYTLNVDRGKVQKIMLSDKKKKHCRTPESMMAKIESYQELLKEYVDDICNAEHILFK